MGDGEKRPSVKPERGELGGASRTSEKTEGAETPKWPPVGHFRRGHAVNQTHVSESSYRIWLPKRHTKEMPGISTLETRVNGFISIRSGK